MNKKKQQQMHDFVFGVGVFGYSLDFTIEQVPSVIRRLKIAREHVPELSYYARCLLQRHEKFVNRKNK